MIATLFFPIWTKADASTETLITLTAFELSTEIAGVETENKATFYIALLALATAATAMVSITKFKNRLLQIKLGALSSFLMAALLLTCLYLANEGEQQLNPSQQGNYVIGFFLPAAGLMFNLLANRFIRRDEMLVKSADRLR
jgi:ABC-type transport system involved in cytochrome c biogenesis permease subunit